MKPSIKTSLLVLSLALSASTLVGQANSDPSTNTPTPPANTQQNNNVNINLDTLYTKSIDSKSYNVSLSQGGLVVVSYHKNIADSSVESNNSSPEVLSQSSSTSKGGIKTLTYQPLQVGTSVLTFNISHVLNPVPETTTITLNINVTE